MIPRQDNKEESRQSRTLQRLFIILVSASTLLVTLLTNLEVIYDRLEKFYFKLFPGYDVPPLVLVAGILLGLIIVIVAIYFYLQRDKTQYRVPQRMNTTMMIN